MQILGKTIKYTLWAATIAYFYHLYLVFNTKKPEEGFGANQDLLEYAQITKYFYEDIKSLLTRPPVNSLLMPRPPLPPG